MLGSTETVAVATKLQRCEQTMTSDLWWWHAIFLHFFWQFFHRERVRVCVCKRERDSNIWQLFYRERVRVFVRERLKEREQVREIKWERKREREREHNIWQLFHRERVRVCVWERERESKWEREYVCVRVCVRVCVCVFVFVCERDRDFWQLFKWDFQCKMLQQTSIKLKIQQVVMPSLFSDSFDFSFVDVPCIRFVIWYERIKTS